MALTYRALKLLAPYLHNARVLSLGYPDLVVPDTDFLGVKCTKYADTGRWHGVTHALPETLHVFDLLGSTLDCIDIHASRGCERVLDLNYPQPLADYDLVIDAGTIEHCFNIGQAILNAAGAVKVGGRIFHSPPMTMVNHGFYNLCPTLLHDFYKQNEWDLEHLSGWTMDKIGPVAETDRWHNAPAEVSLFCIAKRLHDGAFIFPTQQKYLDNPELK